MSGKLITVYEHDRLFVRHPDDGTGLTRPVFEALQKFYGKGVPYYSLLNNGIRFCEYVGVLQVGNTIIEILPKTDKHNDAELWRDVLIGMVRAVGTFKVQAPTSSNLQIKPNSILDLYIELFCDEIQHLQHQGLVKQYRKVTENSYALKGNILFAKHLQINLVHQERFFTTHTIYDHDHQLHKILYKALLLVSRLNTNPALKSRIGSILLDFPGQKDIAVTQATFDRLSFNRKTERYRQAIEIARLLLLNYHPNVSQGTNHVLALMMDMNLLWERFVLQSLRERLYKEKLTVNGQDFKNFWRPDYGEKQTLRPDIIINKNEADCVVLDTKWKNIGTGNPAPDDLRQLYVYHDYYHAKRVALVYPCAIEMRKGTFFTPENKPGDKECSVMGIKPDRDISRWKKDISKQVIGWIKG